MLSDYCGKWFFLMRVQMTVGNYMKFGHKEIKYQQMFTDIEIYSIISFPVEVIEANMCC